MRDGNREVIVLGSGLGGLIAGIFLCKRGHSVWLIKEKRYHPFLEIKGFRFSPFSSFSEKLLERRVLEEISEALDVSLPDSKKNKDFQVLLPGARVDLASDRLFLQREWKREFPGELPEVEKFYDEVAGFRLEPRSFFWRELLPRGVLEKGMDERLSQFSISFKEFITVQLISWGSFFGNRIPVAWGGYILSKYVSDQVVSGIETGELQTHLLDQFSRSGGRIEETEGLEAFNKKWRKGFTVSLSEGGSFRSDSVVLNMPLHRLENLLGKKERSLLKWRKRVKPRYLLFPCFLGIHEKVVPVGMKHLLVSVFDSNRPYAGGNLLFLSLSPKGDETRSPEGRRALTVESCLPVGNWNDALFEDHQKGVMRHLNHIFPFLEDHTEFVESSWGREQITRWSYPCIGHEATCEFSWRKGNVPTRISRDLYFVGRENAPYLGLEGEVRNGLKIGRIIAGEKPAQYQ